MSRTSTPWDLPDRTIDRADEADREIRMSDFVLMAALPFRGLEVAGYPVNELAMAGLVGLCLFRRSRGGARLPGAAVLILTALLSLMLASGIANGNDEWIRRMGHLAILVGLIWAGGTGRLSPRSVAAGLAGGLIVVLGLAVVGIGGDYYPGRLTGFLADPNAGAYFVVVLGGLAIFFCDERRWVKVAVAVPIIAGLILCFSRTGFLAGAFAAVWIVFGRRLGQVAGTCLAVGLVWLVTNIPQALTTVGPFSDRSGSDKLRDRIIAQERVELASAPWYGNGPGTGRVRISELEFFFHNSYLSTRQEGGWLALLLVLALMAYTFARLSEQSHAGDLPAAAVQAALIGTAVMAVTLGEVLLDTPVGIVIGLGLGHALRTSPQGSPPDG